ADRLPRGARARSPLRFRADWGKAGSAGCRSASTRGGRMKTILITGATAGFGEAAARKFAAGGWRVIGTGRRAERLRALQDELGDAFLPLEIDMRDMTAVESLAKLAPPWGDVDLLLN